jgi:hypothetical protein
MTARELTWAAEGKAKSEWGRWSSLMALIAEPNRDVKKHPEQFTADEFNPMVALRRIKKSNRSAMLEIRAAIEAKMKK